MANSASARKRARQAVKRRLHNQALRSRMRTYIKGILAAVASGDKEAAIVAYKQAVPFIDSAVSKKLIHKNKASRNKSRLNARVKAMT
ncbi:MAG: 30S ribosomal protein S20 [Methylococcales bacterium]